MDRDFSLPGPADRERVLALFEQAKHGSAEAVGELIEACRNYLLLIANQELPGALRAKLGPSDIVQDTAWEAQRDFAMFEGERLEQLLAWLRRILLNNTLNATRRYQCTDKRDVSREISLTAAERGDDPIDQCLTPRARLAAIEQQERLTQSLDRLPADMRAAIVLRNRENLSFAEIGLQLDRSAEAARKLWARAVERLRDELNTANERN